VRQEEEKKVTFNSPKPVLQPSLESSNKPTAGQKGVKPFLQLSPIAHYKTVPIAPVIECKLDITEENPDFARSISERLQILVPNRFMAAMLTGEAFFGSHLLSFFLIILSLCAIGIFLGLSMNYMSSKIDRNREEDDNFIMSHDTLKTNDSNVESPSFMQSVSYLLQYPGKNLYEQCTKFCTTSIVDTSSVTISEKFGTLKDREEQEHYGRGEHKEEFSGEETDSYIFPNLRSTSAYESSKSSSSESGSNVPDENIVLGQWSQVREIERLKEMGMIPSEKAVEATTRLFSPYIDVNVEEKSDVETHIDPMALNQYHEDSMASLSFTVVHPSLSPENSLASVSSTVVHSSISPVRTITNKRYKSIYPFDGNGVIYFLNSLESPKVRVKMSTVFAGSEIDIISQSSKFNATYTENEVNSWVALDLGQGRRLIPTHYCIRHGAASQGNALRNWQLRARVRENDNWEILKEHVNDNTLSDKPLSTAKWEIQLPLSAEVDTVANSEKGEEEAIVAKGYRYFLVLQTDINSSNNNCLFISGIEFDGFLSERQ
jgi:hypothetical protein